MPERAPPKVTQKTAARLLEMAREAQAISNRLYDAGFSAMSDAVLSAANGLHLAGAALELRLEEDALDA